MTLNIKTKKKSIISIALLLVFVTALISSGCQNDSKNIGNFAFTKENYPKMGGSLANQPLGEAVTATVLGISREEAANMIVFENSTTANYNSLVNGDFDILLAYEPSEEAKQYAKEQNFEWEMTPIGRDALVFIANKENPVDSLTTQQIKDIYTGKIVNWQTVGGNDAEILAYQRNESSGSQTLFRKLLMHDAEPMAAPTDKVIGSMIGLLEVIAAYDNAENALGFTVYYYLTNMESDKLQNTKILKVNDIEASNATIKSGQYPFTNDFYVVIPKNLPQNDPARILYNWIVSEQGKELVERENYVAIDA